MRVAKIEQRGQAIRLQRAALEFRVAHFQSVHFSVESFIVPLRAAQANVPAPAAFDAIRDPGCHALKRRHHLDCPNADQPDLALPLDLHGQQQQLRDDDSGE